MKRAFTILSVVLTLATFARAQQTVGESVRWTVGPPPTVSGLTAGIVGNPGNVTLYYWVAARYPSGLALPAGPVRVNNTVGIANLSGTRYVTLSWRPASGATGYYVIRQTQPQFPQAGTCANCVVSANQAGTTFNDQGGAVVGWPPGGVAFAGGASAALTLDNINVATPVLNLSGASLSGGVAPAGFVPNSMVYSNAGGVIVSTAAPTDGQLLIGDTGAIPVLATLTGTANRVTVTNGAGTITLSAPQDLATTSVPTFGGVTLGIVTFAALGAPANGTVYYCSNCDPAIAGAGPTVCASSPGTGTLAIRLNGAWTCLGI